MKYPMYKKGKYIQITTVDGRKVRGKSLGVINAVWDKKIGSEPTLRIEKRNVEIAVALRNIKRR